MRETLRTYRLAVVGFHTVAPAGTPEPDPFFVEANEKTIEDECKRFVFNVLKLSSHKDDPKYIQVKVYRTSAKDGKLAEKEVTSHMIALPFRPMTEDEYKDALAEILLNNKISAEHHQRFHNFLYEHWDRSREEKIEFADDLASFIRTFTSK